MTIREVYPWQAVNPYWPSFDPFMSQSSNPFLPNYVLPRINGPRINGRPSPVIAAAEPPVALRAASNENLIPISSSNENLIPISPSTSSGSLNVGSAGGNVRNWKPLITKPALRRQVSNTPLLKRSTTSLNIQDLTTAAKDIVQLRNNPNAEVANKTFKGIRFGDAALAAMALTSIGRDYKNLIPKQQQQYNG